MRCIQTWARQTSHCWNSKFKYLGISSVIAQALSSQLPRSLACFRLNYIKNQLQIVLFSLKTLVQIFWFFYYYYDTEVCEAWGGEQDCWTHYLLTCWTYILFLFVMILPHLSPSELLSLFSQQSWEVMQNHVCNYYISFLMLFSSSLFMSEAI